MSKESETKDRLNWLGINSASMGYTQEQTPPRAKNSFELSALAQKLEGQIANLQKVVQTILRTESLHERLKLLEKTRAEVEKLQPDGIQLGDSGAVQRGQLDALGARIAAATDAAQKEVAGMRVRLHAVKHGYKHAKDAAHRQAVLSNDAQSIQTEAKLQELMEKARSAFDEGKTTPFTRAIEPLEKLVAVAGRIHEAHDHADKKKARKAAAENAQRQEQLGGAAERVKSSPALVGKPALVQACDRYQGLLAGGKKNSPENEAAIDELLNQLNALPNDLPAEVANQMEELKKSATAEKARLTTVRETLDRACSSAGPLKFANQAKFGDAATTGAQNQRLQALIRDEAAKSNVFVDLLGEIMQSGENLDMITGKGSCALFDSFQDGTVDTSHFDILPDQPQEVQGCLVGLTKGEILMHVLEERLYSRQKCKSGDAEYANCAEYAHAHNKCLAPGSYQNLYRREMGLQSDTLQLTNGKTRDGHTGFQHQASDGAISTTPIHGINMPGFQASPDHFEYELTGKDGYQYVMDQFKKTLEGKFRNGAMLDAEGKFDRAKVPEDAVADWRVWLAEQSGDKNKAKEILEGIIAELGAKYEQQRSTDKVRIADQSRAASGFLSAKPDAALNPGSGKLRERRKQRDALGPLNDAAEQFVAWQRRRDGLTNDQRLEEDRLLPKTTNAERVNCAITSLGAITGQKSSDFVKDWFTKNGRPEMAATCAGLQGDDMWAFIEQGRIPESDPNDTDHLRDLLNGDAQLRGIRRSLADEATKRGEDWRVVQDGLNDTGGMHSKEELVKRMEQYPDGTQFQVFVKGDMRHWVYAEKFDGQLVIEDYQMSSTQKGEPQSAKLATEGLPDNPLSGLSDAFGEGMFLALAPIPKGTESPQHNADPSWPEVGSDEDKLLSELVGQLVRQSRPAEFAAVLDKYAGRIPPLWCNVQELAAAIRTAQANYDLLCLPADLAGDPGAAETRYRRLQEALPKIKAANKQIDLILANNLVLKLQYPRPQPKPKEFTGLVNMARSIPKDMHDMAELTTPFDELESLKARTKDKPTDDPDYSRLSAGELSAATAAFDKMEAAIGKLPAELASLKSELENQVRSTKAQFEGAVRDAKVKQQIPNAAAFYTQLTTAPAELAALCGVEEGAIKEIISAAGGVDLHPAIGRSIDPAQADASDKVEAAKAALFNLNNKLQSSKLNAYLKGLFKPTAEWLGQLELEIARQAKERLEQAAAASIDYGDLQRKVDAWVQAVTAADNGENLVKAIEGKEWTAFSSSKAVACPVMNLKTQRGLGLKPKNRADAETRIANVIKARDGIKLNDPFNGKINFDPQPIKDAITTHFLKPMEQKRDSLTA